MIYPTKKQIRLRIENLIDHYTPYRPLTDSKEAKEVRKVLNELLGYINNDASSEVGE